ncbi:MAG: hypothetical protein ACM3SS_01950 [Rhodospirillaceae bacterium]
MGLYSIFADYNGGVSHSQWHKAPRERDEQRTAMVRVEAGLFNYGAL